MTDIIDFLDELRELHALYKQDDLREIDFEARIRKLEREVERFEEDMTNDV